MPRTLHKIPFGPNLLAKVQDFDCGDDPEGHEAAAWIKAQPGTNGALDEMQDSKRQCEVWLHATAEDGLVAFSSLGATRWPWLTPDDPKMPISIIPWVGILKQFQGQPRGAGERRFSDQIMDHLRFEAANRAGRLPILGLCVSPTSVGAIKVYKRAGFVELADKPFKDPDTGKTYLRMFLRL